VRCHEVSSATQPIRIKTSDGYCLSGMLFIPPSTAPTRLIVISAATGVPQQFYAAYAQHLSTLGCAVVTYDYRGVGQSRPSSLRGFKASLRDWVNDIGDVIRYSEEKFPGLSICLLGHSVGGIVSLFAPQASQVDRIVTVGAQTAYWKDWPLTHRLQRFAMWHIVFPAATRIAGYFPGRRLRLGEDLPAPFALEWARSWRHPDQLTSDLKTERLRKRECNVIAVGITDDTIGTEKALRRLHDLVPTQRLAYHWIRPSGHNSKKIGHFDVFRSFHAASLWHELDDVVVAR